MQASTVPAQHMIERPAGDLTPETAGAALECLAAIRAESGEAEPELEAEV